MNEALRWLMGDEFEEELRKATAEATAAATEAANLTNIRSLRKAQRLDAGEAMRILSVPDADRERYEALLRRPTAAGEGEIAD